MLLDKLILQLLRRLSYMMQVLSSTEVNFYTAQLKSPNFVNK